MLTSDPPPASTTTATTTLPTSSAGRPASGGGEARDGVGGEGEAVGSARHVGGAGVDHADQGPVPV